MGEKEKFSVEKFSFFKYLHFNKCYDMIVSSFLTGRLSKARPYTEVTIDTMSDILKFNIVSYFSDCFTCCLYVQFALNYLFKKKQSDNGQQKVGT